MMMEITDLTPAEVRQKTFSSRWRGYAPLEVKAFLDRLADYLLQLQQQRDSLLQELERRKQELAEFKKREQLLKDTLINAQQVIEAMKVNAQKEAENIIHEAEVKAERLLQEAFQRQARIKEDITQLTRLRAELQTQLQGVIDRFRQHLADLESAAGDTKG